MDIISTRKVEIKEVKPEEVKKSPKVEEIVKKIYSTKSFYVSE